MSPTDRARPAALIDDLDGAGLEILDRAECLRLLAGGGLGRIGINVGALPRILPVRFALDVERIVLCVSTGTALDHATCDAVVAFEADGSVPHSDGHWSVSLVGVTRRLDDPIERARANALGLPHWQSAHRFVAISTDHLSGRRTPQR